MFGRIKKYFENVRYIEAIKAEYYAKGQDEATGRFISNQKGMIKKIEELTKQNNDTELRLRSAADQRIQQMEELHEEKCSSCRANLEAERQRLLRRQNQIAKKSAELEEVLMKVYQHINNIIDEHDILLRASGRIVASRNVLMDFKKSADGIMQETAPLLSIELHDGSSDKVIDITSIKVAEDNKK